MISSKYYYLSGPMRGFPNYNYPLFHRVAAALRANGLTVISPAEADSDAVQSVAMRSATGQEFDDAGKGGRVGDKTAGELLSHDVLIIHDNIDAIVFLPNWQRSRGARLEAFVALLQLRPFEFYLWNETTGAAELVSRDYIRNLLKENMP
jgi:hypothetical protein